MSTENIQLVVGIEGNDKISAMLKNVQGNAANLATELSAGAKRAETAQVALLTSLAATANQEKVTASAGADLAAAQALVAKKAEDAARALALTQQGIGAKDAQAAVRGLNAKASADLKAADAVQSHTSALESHGHALQGIIGQAQGGDYAGVFSSVASALGGVASGALLATGAIVGAGVAAAAAAIEFTKWSFELEKLRASADNAFGPDGVGKAFELQKSLGGDTADIIHLANALKFTGGQIKITAEQVAELHARSKEVGSGETEAYEAFGAAVSTGREKALKAIGVYVDLAAAVKDYAAAQGVAAEALSDSTLATIRASAITAELDRRLASTSDAMDRQENALDALDNMWLKYKLQISDALNGPMSGVVEKIVETVGVTMNWGKAIFSLGAVIAEALLVPIQLAIDAITGLGAAMVRVVQGDFKGAAEIASQVQKQMVEEFRTVGVDAIALGAKFKTAWDNKPVNDHKRDVLQVGSIYGQIADSANQYGVTVQALIKRNADEWDKSAKINDDRRAKSRADAEKAAALHIQQIEFAAKTEDSLFKARIAAVPVEDAAEKARLETLYVEFDTINKMDKARLEASKLHVSSVRAVQALEQERENRLKAIDNAELTRKNKAIDAQSKYNDDVSASLLKSQLGSSKDPSQDARIKLQIVEIDRLNALKKARSDAAVVGMSAERALLAVEIDAENKRKSIDDAETKRKQDQAFAVAGAVIAGFESMGAAGRVFAAFKAIYEGAEAWAAAASYQYAAAIQHSFAAIGFASAALSSAPASPSASGGASPAAPSSSGKSGDGAPRVTVIQFGFGTIQQMGRAVHQAVNASKNTGFASAA